MTRSYTGRGPIGRRSGPIRGGGLVKDIREVGMGGAVYKVITDRWGH